MSSVDLLEIPSARGGNAGQDEFEHFARDFLSALGLTIEKEPNRGADGGCDFLARESLSGPIGGDSRLWLVSAKHYAHSNRSVTARDESNISDRITTFGAHGIIAFYSTLPERGLSDTLRKLNHKIFDAGLIANLLISKPELDAVFRQYLPRSYEQAYEADKRERLRLSTEAGLTLMNDLQVEISLNDLFQVGPGNDFEIPDADIRDLVVGSFLAQAFRQGNFAPLRSFITFRPLVWNQIVSLVSERRVDTEALAVAIKNESNSASLRLLIRLAGVSGAREAVPAICYQALSHGKRHHRNVSTSSIPVTPFMDVVQESLTKLSETEKDMLEKHIELARQREQWQAKAAFEKALRPRGVA